LNANDKPMAWSEAVREASGPERAQFLESHLDLVRHVALRISARLPASVELDDLVHDGVVGLLDAAERFDPFRSVRFRTYAESRIRGAILDGLRAKDWRPRSVRHLKRSLDAAIGELAATHGRAASEEEIARAMGVGLEEYRALLADLSAGALLSIDDLPPATDPVSTDGTERPDRVLEHADLVESLGEEIARLPERERNVLALYYHEGLNMKEVGAVLGITESRVCQLHSQAASRLRAALATRLHAAPVGVRGGRD
jgi:RNA polymerase sigma factor for flagellar operon FliA